ncbi:MAG: hypothetical protein E6J71_10235 [Deltaproteobacteria bacterium]|nr:MAG: hypothetical protein E6J71_10235 [Deltaproteobacteria bacterium]
MKPAARMALGRVALLTASLAAANVAARAALESRAFGDRLRVGSAGWRAIWLARPPHGEQLGLAYDTHDPELGWTLASGLRDVPLASAGSVSSNSRGVRGAREHALAKASGTTRIVAIGDSFTFGDDVGDDETFPAQLQRSLAAAEVLNLGVHGYGHDQMLLRLRRDGLPYAPDIVLVGWVAMDAERDMLSFRDYAKPLFVLQDGRLQLAIARVPPPADLIRSARFTPALALLVDAAVERLAWREDPARRARVAGALLAEIVRETRAARATPVFVELSRAAGPGGSMQDVCAEQRIDCVFTAADLAAASAAGTRVVRLSHLSPEGNAIVAASVRAYLESHRLLAARSSP